MDIAAVRPRFPGRSQVDQATVTLLRSVMTDCWRADEAADQFLLRTRADSRLLRLVRAKVARAVLDRPSRVHQRALLTIDKALTRAIAQEGGRAHGRGGAAIPAQRRIHD